MPHTVPMPAIHAPLHDRATTPTAAADARAIISFWFDRPEPMKAWFGGSEALDAAIAQQFGATMAAAARGDCDAWQSTPEGTLALLLLLDQFPRNVYRKDGRAYGTDGKALQVALGAIARGFDRKVPFTQQIFFYLPLEHDENLTSQVASVALIEALMARASDDEARDLATAFYDYALRHRATIVRFGRYPSRNALLGRTTTDDEAAFLLQHPTGF